VEGTGENDMKFRSFRVTADLTISLSTVVVAKTAAEAKRKALIRGVVGLCYQCAAGDDQKEWVTSGELDGEPTNLRIDGEVAK
jgi:hypothetical protein